jgi:hypothetical protein
MVETSSGSCPMADFDIRCVEASGSTTSQRTGSLEVIKPQMSHFQAIKLSIFFRQSTIILISAPYVKWRQRLHRVGSR